MESRAYIERLVREFNSRNPEHIEAHDAQLESLFEQVQDLSSPQKEERLVELIVQVNCDEPQEVLSVPHKQQNRRTDTTARP